MRIEFTKLVGSGNDFIILDNRQNLFDAQNAQLVKKLCNRIIGIGADGIILIEASNTSDFKMRILNSDGSEAEMCGNGARCVAFFAVFKGIARKNMRFETLAGKISAEVDENAKNVKLKMITPHSLVKSEIEYENSKKFEITSINTGVPHAVIFTNELEAIDVDKLGRFVRNHPNFAPKGTNVNFVKITENNNIFVRTYERGVESETLSCGSGSTASALISALTFQLKSPVKVHTKSGEVLTIYFEIENNVVKNVYLEGKVAVVFEGSVAL